MIASHHLGSFRHCDLELTPNHLRTNGNQELWHALLVPVMEFMELCNGNMLKRCLWTSVFWSPVTVLQLCQSVGTMIFVVLQMRVSRVSQGSKNQQVTSHKYRFSWFPPSVFFYILAIGTSVSPRMWPSVAAQHRAGKPASNLSVFYSLNMSSLNVLTCLNMS